MLLSHIGGQRHKMGRCWALEPRLVVWAPYIAAGSAHRMTTYVAYLTCAASTATAAAAADDDDDDDDDVWMRDVRVLPSYDMIVVVSSCCCFAPANSPLICRLVSALRRACLLDISYHTDFFYVKLP